MAGAGVEGRDGRGIGTTVGRQAVGGLELAQGRGQIGVGRRSGKAEPAAHLARALGGRAVDPELGQKRPARAIGGKAAT